MKRKICLVFTSLFLVACGGGKVTSDTTPPVITINGSQTITLTIGEIYTELNATANDDVDGFVSVTFNGIVDTSNAGTYTITYTAHDSSNNSVSVVRKVIVALPQGPYVSIQQGRSTISLEETKSVLVAFVISFIDGSDSPYSITLDQSIQGGGSGINLSNDYPSGGWSATEGISWVVNATLQAVESGSYTLISTATVAETNQVFTVKMPITVSELGSTGQIVLSAPGSDIDALALDSTESISFTAKVFGSTQPPSFIILEQTNNDGLQVINELGNILDDGVGDDILANDLVYSGQFNITGNTEEVIYFRATTGVGKNKITSNIHSIAITRFITSIAPSDPNFLVDDGSGSQLYANEILVKFIDGISPARIKEIVSAEGGSIVGTIMSLGVFQIKLTASNSTASVQSAIQVFMTYTEVEYAEANYIDEIGIKGDATLF